jgi:hypothetical protein
VSDLLSSPNIRVIKSKEDGRDGIFRTHGDEKYTENFSVKTSREKITWKT